MTLAGGLFAWRLRPAGAPESPEPVPRLGNPLRLIAAIKFGLLFAAVRFLARAASEVYGRSGTLASSAIGGSVDVDAIVFSLAGLLRESRLETHLALWSLLLALAANAALKSALGWSVAGARFARPLIGAFLLMFAAALAWTIARA
jgi:uncharacterized membrane protein (DUF4010 family)